ncbi:MAG: hypothetical protein KC592_00225 [Nitrospira sp.]|nr:hypothetical protein [Nitrospira sp.]
MKWLKIIALLNLPESSLYCMGMNGRQEQSGGKSVLGFQEATPFEWGGSLFIWSLIGRLQKADF